MVEGSAVSWQGGNTRPGLTEERTLGSGLFVLMAIDFFLIDRKSAVITE